MPDSVVDMLCTRGLFFFLLGLKILFERFQSWIETVTVMGIAIIKILIKTYPQKIRVIMFITIVKYYDSNSVINIHLKK